MGACAAHCCWHKGSWILLIMLALILVVYFIDIYNIIYFAVRHIPITELALRLSTPLLTGHFAIITVGLMYVAVYYEFHSVISIILIFVIWSITLGICGVSIYFFQYFEVNSRHRSAMLDWLTKEVESYHKIPSRIQRFQTNNECCIFYGESDWYSEIDHDQTTRIKGHDIPKSCCIKLFETDEDILREMTEKERSREYALRQFYKNNPCGYSFREDPDCGVIMQGYIENHANYIFIHTWIVAGAVFFSILVYLTYYCFFRDYYEKTVKEGKPILSISDDPSMTDQSVTEIPSGSIKYESFEGYRWGSVIHSARRTMKEADRVLGIGNTAERTGTYGTAAADAATKSQYKNIVVVNIG